MLVEACDQGHSGGQQIAVSSWLRDTIGGELKAACKWKSYGACSFGAPFTNMV